MHCTCAVHVSCWLLVLTDVMTDSRNSAVWGRWEKTDVLNKKSNLFQLCWCFFRERFGLSGNFAPLAKLFGLTPGLAKIVPEKYQHFGKILSQTTARHYIHTYIENSSIFFFFFFKKGKSFKKHMTHELTTYQKLHPERDEKIYYLHYAIFKLCP